MKTVLTTLNAKYIHTSLALRLLYVANKDRFDIELKEYAIKEDIGKIMDELLNSGCDVLCIGVYIWNVKQVEHLVSLVKKQNPNLIIVLGGPEVMYEPRFFLANWPVDYIVSGEGEFVLGELLFALENGTFSDNIKGVSSRIAINTAIVQANMTNLVSMPSPYMIEKDASSLAQRLVYFETSRGCPYQCQYCLSSLEKGVRYYPQDYIFSNLSYLINSGARQIKFLDRTFNLNKKHTRSIFDFLIQNYREELVCQFEIYADLLDDEMIDYLNTHLPTGFFRFEIGIQSTYEPTNVAVKRKQSFALLASNVKKLMDGGKVDLHLDLIAGLPFETYERFVKSFNDVFALGAKEVQLGFLKMLRGTNLRRDAEKYGYRYKSEAPYEIECNTDISEEELARIHDAEHALEKYWNSGRFRLTMNKLFETEYRGKYFEFFDELGQFYKQNQFPHHGYQLEDLFKYLNQFLLSKRIDMFDFLRTDYYNNFNVRPKALWYESLDKSARKCLLYTIGQDKEFLQSHQLTRKIIEKQTVVDYLSENEYLLTVFLESERKIFIYRANISGRQ